ncbi:gliding motility-associated ABC transporter substrate-binding protein GldG [Sinomicrobium weinanense]|uniref:Gliding motility-associated ABC transporter substrate-binding protein GldG n=1 Tax=Sinomicrobium weinanense TaxID=2842200 RepID=A0A926JRU4_9FLAO|nr:gliding motility-associated ABC transporter substrate-binding protein GldG [Sinomicrobium weinanense]MBC9796288.1 gliding motility-associated ABC transporter substrate-binding protein GldG [Sinomicrobium weinanense]MBU3123231.1 gliding motility-associated ABC transporter substrate-binding protein GldG [Sinomicrobium weinanense]
MNKKNILNITIILALLVVLHYLSTTFYGRFDLTHDKRYTLSEASLQPLKKVEIPLVVDVFLDGDLPPEFRKLHDETRQILEEFAARNKNIRFNFVDPLEDEENSEAIIRELQSMGLTPLNFSEEKGGKISQEMLFPWALANYGDKSVRVPLLKNKLGASDEERVRNSVQQLEYVFADAFAKLTIENKQNIAVLKGNGELDDIYMADFLTTLRDYYNLAPFTLDSVAASPQKTLRELKNYDMLLVAKPTEAFSDEEKAVLDQYTMRGGKSLWLIDQVSAEMDSLYNASGRTFALPRDLNLRDMFFSYGVRINPVLVNDLYFTQIVLASGEGNSSRYDPYPWYYSPMVFSPNNHPVNNNIEALRFEFANAMDTLKNNVQKTVLLTSSPLSKTVGTPVEINLDIITEKPDKESYNNGLQPLAILLEGKFNSMYKNRVKPLELEDNLEEGTATKMIVISDGDLIKNQLNKGRPLELGYDKWTNNFYGNKEFLKNCVNYLLDDNGLIYIRSKEVAIPFLDKEKVTVQHAQWKAINLGFPLLLLALSGFIFTFIRKRKYTSTGKSS